MALRTDLPKIPAQESPTIWNQTMGKWAFWGSLAASAVSLAVTGLPAEPVVAGASFAQTYAANILTLLPNTIVGLGGAAVAGLIGGARGKAEMQRESMQGKTVKEPTFWNKGILSNYMAAAIPIGIGATVLAAMGGPVSATVIGLGGSALTLLAGISGGFAERNQMRQEVALAENISQQQQLALTQGRGRGQGQSQSFEMAQSVEQTHDQSANQVTAADMATIERLLEARAAERGGHEGAAMESKEAAELVDAHR